MRIIGLEISGFRGFAGIQRFDLDVRWISGPRTPDWDSLWTHIFRSVLSYEILQEDSDSGEDDRLMQDRNV